MHWPPVSSSSGTGQWMRCGTTSSSGCMRSDVDSRSLFGIALPGSCDMRRPCLQKIGTLLFDLGCRLKNLRQQCGLYHQPESEQNWCKSSRRNLPRTFLEIQRTVHPCVWLVLYRDNHQGLPRPMSFITLIRFTATSSYRSLQSSALLLRALRCPTSKWQANFTPGQGLDSWKLHKEGLYHQGSSSTEEYQYVGRRL
ncbi:hypothetical protein ARMSODRAFT_444531 [Armillaria solidipes]|uniref:Uncharacterized protein n=1 Tax=Armillaria solidipes TaxID=1076256 RepID=A0A2H3B622_9AGAR|nr:hypothetical protein ARMSODRAFT_444531 [Armillaria solidipes]